MKYLTLVIALVLVQFAPPAFSQSCGEAYRVQRGDNLSAIAWRAYQDANKWSVIYQANVETIGYNPHLIQIGQRFRIPCLDRDVSETRQWTQGEDKTVRLLTANDYAPFTDQSLPGGGLVTEIVDAAVQASPDMPSAGIVWVDDWSQHLEPLLSEHRYDLGFPWLKPDCTETPDNLRCRAFIFSEPMFEMLVLLFTDSSNPMGFTRDSDIVGKTLCRPNGYYTHDLDKDGRRWLAEGKITLRQPDSVNACFQMLLDGQVDAVALNEFTGRSAVQEMGIDDRVEIIQTRPLSIEGLHVLVAKSHPRADELIGQVNDGLATLKADGTYQQIVDRHLAEFWARF